MILLQETRTSSSGSLTKTLSDIMFPFPMISSGAQLGVIGAVSHVGFLLFWRRSRAMSVLDDVMLFMFLIDMASVSQLCSPLYYSYYMGCCEDCLTCDICLQCDYVSKSCLDTWEL